MSLVSVATVKEYLPEIQGSGADTALASLTDRVEESIARYLGFPGDTPILTSASVVFYVDAPMASDPSVLQLPAKPIISINSVHTDPNLIYGSDTSISSDDYTVDLVNGRIILLPTKGSRGFYSAFRANKIGATIGFQTEVSGNAPDDLIHAICVWTSQLQRQKQTQGKYSVSQRGTTIKTAPFEMPREVKQILNRFRSSSVIL